MERRFRVRLAELLHGAEAPPGPVRGVLPRLEAFLQPLVAALDSAAQRTKARHYVPGLLSDLKRKGVEAIAYLHDRDRQGLQKLIGQADWGHRPLVTEPVRQVGAELGEPDGAPVLDPSAFAKQGTGSVGVQRQWCGRLGELDNCQVGLYLGYVARQEHALVDFRLYLPKGWAQRQRRRRKAGVPKAVRFRTRQELAPEMLDERGPWLPRAWVTGDDEMGRSAWSRGELRPRSECSLLAVPSDALVRDLAGPGPPYAGRGRRPGVPFRRADRWRAGLAERAWQAVEVRAGEKGPLVVQVAWALVGARAEGKPSGVPEILVVFRERQGDGSWKHDDLLSGAPLSTPVAECARAFNAEHRAEECLKRAKSEAGLAGYQVRAWEGWHHQQALSLLATWLLTQETRRGKNAGACAGGAAGAGADRGAAEAAVAVGESGAHPPHRQPQVTPQRDGAAVPLAESQPLATATV